MGKIIGAQAGEVNKPTKFLAVFGIVAFIVVACVGGFFLVTYIQGLAITPDTPVVLTESSVIMTDWTSKEDLGELCPFTLYGDEGKITNNDERYDITFYKIISTEVMPDDFGKDLSEYDYLMFRVNPDEATDGWWTTYDYFYPNLGGNNVYNLFGYHEATDLYGNVLDITSGTAWDRATDINGTIPLWYPTVTKTEVHRGNHFEIETDLADCSQTILDKLWNEKYYRNMPTLFTLTDDTSDHDHTSDYSWITETFMIEFIFNATISTTDGAVTQVNFTAECDYNFQIELDAANLYFVTTESWDTLLGNFEMFFEISMGTHINCTTVKAGRGIIPGRYFGTDYTFTSLQTLATA